ncbi:Energy-coupling factor transporter transmembrane protein EcfT [Candidatus Zixiibacteriota bacterium]|nr:Energy-coupling factor transporter transmembrane protein EcfT [candidate division Zixibacteria bacterium]
MTNRLIIGQYRPHDSFGHRLDPRAKILCAIFLMIISIFTTSFIFYLFIIAGLGAMLLLSDISIKVILKNSRPFLVLVLITALYHLLFSARDTHPIGELFGFKLTEGGLAMAVAFSLRMLVFVGIAFFVSLTTMPADMAETLVRWLRPARRLGVPINDIGLMVFIAMRFIPVLAEELDTIKKAQIVRGVNFSGGLKNRAKKMTVLLIPVFQAAIRRADDLAIAIESRGYISGAVRSSLRVYKFRWADWLFLAAAVISSSIIFLLTMEEPWLK